MQCQVKFLSTLSLRRATCVRCFGHFGPADFYPRSPCGERPCISTITICTVLISIHALLAESDWGLMGGLSCDRNFYPRSPCGERHRCSSASQNHSGFLSTLSLRRATTDGLFFLSGRENFYPRSPCGERLKMVLPGCYF